MESVRVMSDVCRFVCELQIRYLSVLLSGEELIMCLSEQQGHTDRLIFNTQTRTHCQHCKGAHTQHTLIHHFILTCNHPKSIKFFQDISPSIYPPFNLSVLFQVHQQLHSYQLLFTSTPSIILSFWNTICHFVLHDDVEVSAVFLSEFLEMKIVCVSLHADSRTRPLEVRSRCPVIHLHYFGFTSQYFSYLVFEMHGR